MKRPLAIGVFLVSGLLANSQVLDLYSIHTERQPGGDAGYTLNGGLMSISRNFVTNTTHFGPQGTYKKTVAIHDTFGLSNSMTGIGAINPRSILFFGTFDKNNGTTKPFTEAELDSLYRWTLKGGRMIHTSGLTFPMNNGDMQIMNSRYGFEMSNGSAEELIPVAGITGTTAFNGPFGTIPKISQSGAAQGYYSKLPEFSSVLATDAAGRPTLVMDCKTMDVLIADVDVVTNLNPESMNFTMTTSSNPQKFFGNLIVFMDLLPDPPVLVKNGSQLSVAPGFPGYQWYHNGTAVAGANSAQFSAPATGTTYVLVDVAGGCKVPSDVFVAQVTEDPADTVHACDPGVPTAFSPDNDGNNDKACVHGACVTSLDFRIFDRWGQQVFQGATPGDCWDGTHKGKMLSTGVFAWTFRATLSDGAEVSKKGHITLIR